MSMVSDNLIIVERLTKYFGDECAVDQISFQLGYGEVLGVMGPNGAGKTTTMRMIAGFLAPSSGSVSIAGFDVVEEDQEAKKKLGYLPEGAPLWQDMSVIDFLRFAAKVREVKPNIAFDAIDRALALADLKSVANKKIGTLSKGYRRRVGLAQAIFHDPPVLVLDEPTDGLDPNQKRHIRALIRSMAKTKAIIISTHILEEVEPLCTRILILDHGHILVDESPAFFASRSHYHNAVKVHLKSQHIDSFVSECKKLTSIARSEVITKRKEGQVIFFPKKDMKGEKLAQMVRDIADREKITLDGLAVEVGRLDDVFYQMTSASKSMGGSQ